MKVKKILCALTAAVLIFSMTFEDIASASEAAGTAFEGASGAFEWILEPTPVYAAIYSCVAYDSKEIFDNMWIAVSKYGQNGIINSDGTTVIPCEYDEMFCYKNYIIVKKNGKWGVLDYEGNIIVPFEYEYLSDYSDSSFFFLRAKKDGKYGVLDSKGQVTVPFEYDMLDYEYPPDGKIAAKKDSKYGVIDYKGNIIVPFEYSDLSCYDKGIVAYKDGNYGVLDLNGQVIIPLEYGYIDLHDNYMVTHKKDGGYGVMDYEGNIIVPFEYDDLNGYGSDNFIAARKNGKYGVIDYKGNVIVPFEYGLLYCYGNYIEAEKDGKYGVLDLKGQVIIPFEYDYIGCYDDYIIAKKDGKWGVLDLKGQIIIPFENHGPSCYYYNNNHNEKYDGGCIGLSKENSGSGNTYGLYDSEGNVIFDCISYTPITGSLETMTFALKTDEGCGIVKQKSASTVGSENFEYIFGPTAEYERISYCGSERSVSDNYNGDNWIVVNKDEKRGIINSDGKIVIPCEYDYLYCLENCVGATKNGKITVIDYSGNVIIPFEYDYLYFYDTCILATTNEKHGLIDYKGNEIIPCEYDSLTSRDSGGIYLVAEKDGKCSIFDFQGNLVFAVPSGYEWVNYGSECCEKGIVLKNDGGKYGVMDYQGNILVPFEYGALHCCDKGIVASKDGEYGVIDYQGNVLVPFEHSVIICHENGIVAKKGGKWGSVGDGVFGIFDYKGQVAVPLEYDLVRYNNSGIVAEKGGKWGVVDFKGQVTVPFEYDELYNEYALDGKIAAKKDGKCGVIDYTGAVIIPFEYEYTECDDDYIYAGKDGKNGVIDYEGNIIVPFGDYHISTFCYGGDSLDISYYGKFFRTTKLNNSGNPSSSEDEGLYDYEGNIIFDCISQFPITGSLETMTFALKTDEGCGIVKVNPKEAGTVTINVTSENGTVTGGGTYKKGDSVTLTAAADSGYSFDGFYIDGKSVSTSATYTFTADEDKEIEAKFTKKSTGGGSGGGGGKVSGGAVITNSVASSGKPKALVLTIGSRKTKVDDKDVENDVAPIIRNDRTMLPARFVSENLGAKVEWDGENKKVTIANGKTIIEIFIGWAKAYINGVEKPLDSPAFIENDRTYTPVRFIAEALSAEVDWDAETQQVTITKK